MAEPRYADLVEQPAGDGLDWDDFRIFLEVIRQGSFNKAAGRLGMTQPTVSRRLMRLEKAVGVRLFERDRRGPRLTYEGQRVYNDATAAQIALTRAAAQAGGAATRVNGECKLLMSEALAGYWLPRFVAPFVQRYPNIELKVVGTNDPTPDKRENCDLNVHYFESADGGQGAVKLATLHFLPFASRAYLERRGMPARVEDLADHELLDQAVHLTDVSSWAHWARQSRNARTVFFTNLAGGLGEAVRHGAGIALLPSYAAAVDSCFVPIEIGMRYTAPVSVSVNAQSAQRWPVRAVLDFLRHQVFDRNAMPWFAARYVAPSPDWAELCNGLAAKAAEAAPAGEKR